MSANETEDLVRRLTSAYAGMPRQFEIDVDAIQCAVAARRRRVRSMAALAGVVVTATVGGMAWIQLGQQGRGPQMLAAPVVMRPSGGLETHASSTARDWVENADFVAVVNVTAESRRNATAADDGTDDQLIGRSVTLEVVRQIWTRTGGSSIKAGDSAEVSAPGWVTHADGSMSRVAIDGQPRLEVGHTYVVALVASVCTTDAAVGTLWMTLGRDAVLPADGDRIGYGESEGRTVAGDPDQTTPMSLERQLLGDTSWAIAPKLDAAQADLLSEPSQSSSC